MRKQKIEGLGGEERVKVQIDVNSPEYQRFLRVNQKRADARGTESHADAQEEYLQSIIGVDLFAQKTFQKQKGN